MSASARGGIILVAAFLATAAMNYGLGLLLAWLLVPEEFGYVAIAQAVLYVSAVTLDAGFPWTLTRTLSRAHGRDWAEMSDVLRSTLTGNLVFAALLAAGILLLDAAGTFGLPRREPSVMLLVALTLPFFAVNSIARAALHGMTRFGALGVVKSVEVGSKVLFIAGLMLLLGRGTLLLVVLGTFAGAMVTAILAAWYTRDLRPETGAWAWGQTYLRTVPMFVGTVSMALLLSVDILLLGTVGRAPLITATTIAIYQVGSMLARLPYFLGDALANSVFPFIARRHESPVASHAYFSAAARAAVIAVLPIEVILLLAPTPLLELLFPATYADSVPIVRLLAIGALGALATVFFGKTLQALGKSTAAAAAVVAGVTLEVVAAAILIPNLGAAGAALAFVAGTWSAAALLGFIYTRHQRTTLVRSQDLLRYGLALACSLPTLLVADDLDRFLGIVFIAFSMALYAAALLLLRLVGIDEIRRYVSIAGGLFTPSSRVDP